MITINFDTVIFDINGEPMKDRDLKDPQKFTDLTFRCCAVRSLLSEFQGQGIKKAEKLTRYKLSRRILAHETWSFSEAEAQLVQDCIANFYAPQVVGQVDELFHPESYKDFPKVDFSTKEVKNEAA